MEYGVYLGVVRYTVLCCVLWSSLVDDRGTHKDRQGGSDVKLVNSAPGRGPFVQIIEGRFSYGLRFVCLKVGKMDWV